METYNKLEALRNKVKTKTILLILTLLLTMICFILFIEVAIPIVIVGMGCFIFQAYKIEKDSKEYKLLYKKTFIEGKLMEVIDELEYNPNLGLSNEYIKNTGVVSMGNRFYSNDFISGKYNGVFFHQSDVLIQQVTSNGKTTTTTTLFKGRWYTIDLDTEVKNRTVVREATFKLHVGWFTDMEKIELESILFNKKFLTLTNNGQEAFYVLSPKRMEKLLQLETKYDGTIAFGFMDNKIHIAINDGSDHFEPKVWTKLNREEIEKFVEGIDDITKIIDHLEIKTNK